MEKEKIDFIESMKVLKLEPGDILVLKSDRFLGEENRSIIKKHFKDSLKDKGVDRIILLEQGMDIGVLRKENG